MADCLTKEQRSENMRRIRSKDTKPEKAIRSLVHSMGFRYRLHCPSLPGKPDIVLSKYKTIIFCHGCFWHQHKNCKRASVPKTNTDYWIPKLKKNVVRFKKVKLGLKKMGWNVVVIWECETNDANKLSKNISKVLKK